LNLSEATNKVIDLARRVRAYYDDELPKRHPNYPVVSFDEESVPPPPSEKELRRFLATLSDDLIYRLILLMVLGRGDVGTEDLAASYETLTETFGSPKDAVAQMMLYKATLADELSDGLEELRKHKIHVEAITTAIPEDRPLTVAEARLLRWLLEHGIPRAACYLPQLEHARVASRCSCGCASINFAIDGVVPTPGAMGILSDYQWRAAGGEAFGVFVFEYDGLLAGLEVFSMDGLADATVLPDIEQLFPV
jgi:hypothetical protein